MKIRIHHYFQKGILRNSIISIISIISMEVI